ncbi:MAG TPA: DUF554 domain-containing protein [Sediminispirochaeta sp.]|nr:DUF554 domain-containing protein [Sediminispirochaeta sp.]
MIATIVNCIAVLIGSAIGLLLHKNMSPKIKDVVYIGAGLISLTIGMQMSFESQRIVYLALSVILGGMIGTTLNIEGGIMNFGSWLQRTFAKSSSSSSTFAQGFLDASVLFCVGALAIVGSIKAGAEGEYDLILMKSVLDGFMAIMFSAAMGIGVMFSVITILVYQGGLTLLGGVIGPLIGELGLSEISGTGGVLILMIGLNLLKLKEIKTGNFLPALLIVLVFTSLDPVVVPWLQSLSF